MKEREPGNSSEQATARTGSLSSGEAGPAPFEAPCILWEHEFVALTASGPAITPPGCEHVPPGSNNPNCW